MQIKLTIGLGAAFALASFLAFAADVPADGTKNFTAPGDAPSYFTNENSSRVLPGRKPSHIYGDRRVDDTGGRAGDIGPGQQACLGRQIRQAHLRQVEAPRWVEALCERAVVETGRLDQVQRPRRVEAFHESVVVDP